MIWITSDRIHGFVEKLLQDYDKHVLRVDVADGPRGRNDRRGGGRGSFQKRGGGSLRSGGQSKGHLLKKIFTDEEILMD